MSNVRATWGGVVAAGILLLAGCGGSDDNQASDESSHAEDLATQTQAGGSGGDEAAEEADAEAGTGAPSLAVDTVALARARDVIRTGVMEITVDDVDTAADEVRRVVAEADGFVADEQLRADSSEVDLTVRVPGADYDTVRERLTELGDVVQQQFEAQDVTAEVVDVESRVASMRASVERLQTLLGGAGDVAQLAVVEGELARREVELEALLGQQRVLLDQVDLGTLTVRLSEDERPAPDEDAAGFRDGLRQGWVVAVDGGRATLAAIGFLLPFALPAAVVALAVRWWLVRRRPVVAP